MGIWEAIALLVASYLISAALAPKVPSPEPEAFKDIEFPQADQGTPQAVFFGDCWSGDWTVLDVGNYRTTPVYSDQGGKG